MEKLKSLTIFFPFLNDEGTVERQISYAYKIGKRITKNLEVIALHGGPSTDNTMGRILQMKEIYPDLIVIDKFRNTEGYAVIKHGLFSASKDWIFYTDGDAQYRLEKDLPKLIKKQKETGVDVVNGYKKRRKDSFWRIFLGNIYAHFSKTLLQLPIRDVDCDFRLIRTEYIKKIQLESRNASILPELIIKLQLIGARFAEIPVSHYTRVWGKSNYTIASLAKEKIIGDFRLYFRMRKY
ncbi:hypothetical protein A3H80_04580 [Candidatus Roizmanbacteria bacterium RIFCSPLOWO2_02_FULL_37_19]|uniref:Glycosyltransferase 2-like domain-containing protein n=1 Tax=Candidatus Roizmanbacteria bacterium RIFCSPHIGHO2_02_FULL_37_24 TaxID=1802037 RepID=A0A1F7GVJ7_9BACT|nr:MAG: hypothetical protein A2862_01685 [Candidatus Roizmanbacteria bacterium RIFCSPHIGHO2_01_FULL_38_41]OGK22825.1 MAG: hypothetical protein A3C24_04375 [Candidatus Roizmanbacteria bacterium RIFCSPHIGHO2_02_FULL_37_24]OGK33811.1 MAG: hypothetical protein A3E10_02780 [Candidatus Roizmanbacteria bacterium RIFCSPHIGHO2_12_FULL_37_23]OGK43758.1 MAG: hypothetical protein A2956_00555 [Candidatus Roizmanbacteria bacterium RIFCSPLOWO2_01_FULL_37_57]OGK54868.1 MAG: hypothetical protein A3H80_04580 [Ca